MLFRTWFGLQKKRYARLRKYPVRVLALGFAVAILLGSALLWLPFAARQPLTFPEAAFTAASAVCAVGLTVVDTGARFTLFGQIVLLLLIQTGGLCFMSLSALALMILGKRAAQRDRQILGEMTGEAGVVGPGRLIGWIAGTALAVEAAGAALLSVSMVPRFGLAKGVFYSVFHAVSAFCNAGFDLMGNHTSLSAFRNDPWMLTVTMLLIVTGGLGYAVLWDLAKGSRANRRAPHTLAVLYTTAGLVGFGAVFFLLVEWANPETLSHPGLSPWMRPVAALFQSVTLRTAGFHTMDQSAMTDASKLMSVLFMLVGASPASTGGGLKTTTVWVLALAAGSALKGKEEPVAFGKWLPRALVPRALALALAWMGLAAMGIMAITLMEHGFARRESGPEFLEVAFEVFSAFGAVGLSCNLTERLFPASRAVLMGFMVAGRVGPLALLLALARRQQKGDKNARYPEARILIG